MIQKHLSTPPEQQKPKEVHHSILDAIGGAVKGGLKDAMPLVGSLVSKALLGFL